MGYMRFIILASEGAALLVFLYIRFASTFHNSWINRLGWLCVITVLFEFLNSIIGSRDINFGNYIMNPFAVVNLLLVGNVLLKLGDNQRFKKVVFSVTCFGAVVILICLTFAPYVSRVNASAILIKYIIFLVLSLVSLDFYMKDEKSLLPITHYPGFYFVVGLFVMSSIQIVRFSLLWFVDISLPFNKIISLAVSIANIVYYGLISLSMIFCFKWARNSSLA